MATKISERVQRFRQITAIEARALSDGNSDIPPRARNETRKANRQFVARNLGNFAMCALANYGFTNTAGLIGGRGAATVTAGLITVIGAGKVGYDYTSKVRALSNIYQSTHLLESPEPEAATLEDEA